MANEKAMVDPLALRPIESADLILAHGSLAAFMTEPEEAERGEVSWAGHAGIAISPYLIEHALLLTRTDSLRRFTQEHPDYEVWRKKNLSAAQARKIVTEAVKFSTMLYGAAKLLLHGIDRGLTWARYYLTFKRVKGEVFLLRKIIKNSIPVCHEIPGFAYWFGIGYKFAGMKPSEIDPDRIHDFVKKSPEWVMVRKVAGGKVLSDIIPNEN